MNMNSTRHLLFATLASFAVAAIASSCTPKSSAPPSEIPSATPAAPVHPSIVGTVTLSSTKKPAPTGGVVYLEDAPKPASTPMTTHIIIHHKEFVPFIAVLTAGGTASFENTDPMPHHIFSPDVAGWDTGYLKHDHPVTRVFDKTGPVALLCNIHPEMLGYLLVIPSGSFGKIGTDGKYVIGDVPAGSYKATAWIPRQPTVTEPVTVGTGAPVALNFEVQVSGTPH